MLGESKWMDAAINEPDKDYLQGSWDYDTIALRTFDVKVHLENNPLSDELLSHVDILLL